MRRRSRRCSGSWRGGRTEASSGRITGVTDDWLHYQLPQRFVRRHRQPLYWPETALVSLKVLCEETDFCLITGQT